MLIDLFPSLCLEVPLPSGRKSGYWANSPGAWWQCDGASHFGGSRYYHAPLMPRDTRVDFAFPVGRDRVVAREALMAITRDGAVTGRNQIACDSVTSQEHNPGFTDGSPESTKDPRRTRARSRSPVRRLGVVLPLKAITSR